jgi:tetratricopeptide (TPR) repeat protein
VRSDAASDIAHLCGYLPLALRLAGSALAERPDLSPDTYLRRLAKAQKRLELIDASLSLSYDLLSPELRRLWCTLSVFPADFDLPAIAAVWNLDPDAADERLGELLKFSLVEFQQGSGGAEGQGGIASLPSPGRRGGEGGEVESRYKLHDLARLFADSRFDPAGRAEAQQRHATHYKTVLWTAEGLCQQGGNNFRNGLVEFDQERTNIDVGQAWTATHATTDETATQLCSEYAWAWSVLNLRLHPREYIRWLEAALIAARYLRLKEAEGAHLGNLGLAYAALGETRRAIEFYEQALVIDREIGHRQGEGNALGNLGVAYAVMGETRRAIEFYEQHLVIAREIGDRRGEGNALGNLGNAYAARGETRRAIEFYEQHLVIAREIGDRWGEGTDLGNLGLAYADLGESRRAIEFYEQQLVIAREIGDRRGEGNALWNKTLALDKLGQREQAIACAEAALKIREEIEDPRAKEVRQQLVEWRGEHGLAG